MKAIICALALMLCAAHSHAQTWDEWFKQKKTQKKYLLQQIAALQVYLGYVKDGYGIARKGLNTISRIKDGDMKLHELFFSERRAVNPLVKQYSRLEDIIVLQERIASLSGELRGKAQANPWLSISERKYVTEVLASLLSDGAATLDDALNVATPGKLEMTDDERIARIDLLHQSTQDQYAFVQHFSGQLGILTTERAREVREAKHMRLLYGLE